VRLQDVDRRVGRAGEKERGAEDGARQLADDEEKQQQFRHDPEREVLEEDDAPQRDQDQLAPAAQVERAAEQRSRGAESDQIVAHRQLQFEEQEEQQERRAAEQEQPDRARPAQRDREAGEIEQALVLGPGAEAGGESREQE